VRVVAPFPSKRAGWCGVSEKCAGELGEGAPHNAAARLRVNEGIHISRQRKHVAHLHHHAGVGCADAPGADDANSLPLQQVPCSKTTLSSLAQGT